MSAGFEALKIMIVDDNCHMRGLVRTILSAMGVHRFCECENGREAFATLKDFAADILVVDWLMTPMDGIKLVDCIRNNENSTNPYVPIIMMTGHSSLENVFEARDAGVNEFVAKPISARSLMLRVKEIIERPRLFVQSDDYFGPDRRRSDIPVAVERRLAAFQASPEKIIGVEETNLDEDDVVLI